MDIAEKIFKVKGSEVKVMHRQLGGNPLNSIAREPMKRFEPKLTQIRTTLGRRTDLLFKVMG